MLFTLCSLLLFDSYSLKAPVYLKDKAGQVVTPQEDCVVFGPGEYFLDIKCFRARTISPKVDFH